jgi:2'-5' RNA ligase
VGVTAFFVQVPQADPCVGALRSRYDETAGLGMPAHITVLVPFMESALVSNAVLERAAAALRTVPAFVFRLATVGRFDKVAYLAPDPGEPFVALTAAMVRAFPDYPPYGGQYATVVPHLTVAIGDERDAEHASGALSGWLREKGAIHARCTEVTLFEHAGGRWSEMHAFGLGAAAG